VARIVVCFKWVKVEEDIRIGPEDLSVDLSRARGKISDYDRNAIEAALGAAAEIGAEAVGLAYGSAAARPALKEALARGLSEVFWIQDSGAEDADGFVTANVLAAAVRQIGDCALVVCGEGASDTYARQVGPRIGALLDLPVLSCVTELAVGDGTVQATRRLERGTETLCTDLPAVVTILPELCAAPIPGLKAVLAAGRKPQTELRLSELGLAADDLVRRTAPEPLRGYRATRRNVVFRDGDAQARVDALVSSLRREGAL